MKQHHVEDVRGGWKQDAQLLIGMLRRGVKGRVRANAPLKLHVQ